MKKLLIASIIAGSLLSQPSLASVRFTNSELSMISVVLSPALSSAALSSLFTELSKNSTPIKVTQVEHKENNKTTVKGVAKNTPIEFEADTNAIKKAQLKKDDNITVRDAKMGHILECNNVALGLAPSPKHVKNFKQEKLN